jgi:predicted MPP superfamily phosphohydrolase
MRFIIFMSLFLFVFALINLYISKRLIGKLHFSHKIKRYFNIFLIINYLGIVGYLFARYSDALPATLYLLFSLPIGVLFLLFCVAIFYDISHLFINKVPMKENRREFFKKTLDFGSVVLGVGLSAKAMHEARYTITEDVTIDIKNLQQSYSIVQLSDIHIGGLIDTQFIANLVKKVNNLQPDIVVITGDLIDIPIQSAIEPLSQLKNIKSKYGTFFVVGNHEYFHGVEEIISTVNSLGIKVLENESVYVGEKNKGINIAGVYDHFGYRVDKLKPDILQALQNTDSNSPTILLAHQPRFIYEVNKGVDLMLSGHTHGGQLYPFRALVKIVQPYISGLYQHNENTQVYVNRGTGFWGPPMRLGSPSEITNITLQPA